MDYGERFRRGLAGRAGLVTPILRIGLGVVILLAGTHKLLAPEAWTVYVAPPFEPLTGEGAGALIRDIGLVALAVGVTVNAAADG